MYTLCFKANLGTARPPEILINCRQLTILWVLFLVFLLHGCGFKGDTQRQPSRQDKMSAVNVFLKITDTFKRVRVIGDRPYRREQNESYYVSSANVLSAFRVRRWTGLWFGSLYRHFKV